MGSVSQLQLLQWVLHPLIMGSKRANGMIFLHECTPIFHRPKCDLESFLRAHSEPQVGWEWEADWLGGGRDTYWLGGWAWLVPGVREERAWPLEVRQGWGRALWDGTEPAEDQTATLSSLREHHSHRPSVAPETQETRKGAHVPLFLVTVLVSKVLRLCLDQGGVQSAELQFDNHPKFGQEVMGWDCMHRDEIVLPTPGHSHRLRN